MGAAVLPPQKTEETLSYDFICEWATSDVFAIYQMAREGPGFSHGYETRPPEA